MGLTINGEHMPEIDDDKQSVAYVMIREHYWLSAQDLMSRACLSAEADSIEAAIIGTTAVHADNIFKVTVLVEHVGTVEQHLPSSTSNTPEVSATEREVPHDGKVRRS